MIRLSAPRGMKSILLKSKSRCFLRHLNFCYANLPLHLLPSHPYLNAAIETAKQMQFNVERILKSLCYKLMLHQPGSANGDKTKSTLFVLSSAMIALVMALAALMSSVILPVVSIANASVFEPSRATSSLNFFRPILSFNVSRKCAAANEIASRPNGNFAPPINACKMQRKGNYCLSRVLKGKRR